MPTGAFEYELRCLPGTQAGADLTTKQYHFMRFDGNGNIVACDGAGQFSLGLLQDLPKEAGRACSVAYGGVSKCVAGAAIARGALVATNAAGRAVVSAGGAHTVGYALTPAGADGEQFSLVITHAGAAAAA
jgi:hypothetical protein